MALARKIVCLVLLATFMTGFRTFSPETRWDITRAQPKIFVHFCEMPSITTNDLPEGDPLFGQALTFTTVMTSVYADITSIPGSYVSLNDAATDPEWATSTNRTIEVCFKSQTGGGGVAKLKMGSGGKLSGCEIELHPGLTSSAKGFVRTLTHEIGHCLGLDHSHDNDRSLMSYFMSDNIVRLQMDDKMGLIQQFPLDPAYGQESPNFGASCAPRD